MTANGTYRNFLDLTDFEGDELRAILDTSRKIKSSRNGVHRGQGPLAGKVLAMIFGTTIDPYAHFLRCRHARAWRRDLDADRCGNASSAAERDNRRYRRRFCRVSSTRS